MTREEREGLRKTAEAMQDPECDPQEFISHAYLLADGVPVLVADLKAAEKRAEAAEGERDRLSEALRGLLTEPTIAETIRAAENPDKEFAATVPEYEKDCQSIVDAADRARRELGEG
jgi:hypothetical protein